MITSKGTLLLMIVLPTTVTISCLPTVTAFCLPPTTWSIVGRRSSLVAAKTPSWDDLEDMLGPAYATPTPSSIDSVLDPKPPIFSTDRPTFFRERHGWCPYSERVWLTLEMLDVDYDTVRIDNTGGGPRPSYFGGRTTPQIKWPDDGRVQGESYDLVQALDARYNDHRLASDNDQVHQFVRQFASIFPRARPSSRAAFLFQTNGAPLARGTFQETLERTDALLSGGGDGPFWGGSTNVTAADICWAPFLERYRYQLPCLHRGLQPDDPKVHPNLAAWYRAMEERVPAYACRVKGDASSWRKVLSMAGFGNDGTPPEIGTNMEDLARQEAHMADSSIRQDIWEQYAAHRPYVASTPGAEAANIMTRNREQILLDIQKQQQRKNPLAKSLPESKQELDEILRSLVSVLMQSQSKDSNMSSLDNPELVGYMASFLDERMCVPRDMGSMSAACIKELAWKLKS